MRDYDELIERLRYCADRPICFSTQCDYRQTAHIGACFDSLKHDAADAIEELLAAVPKWISVEERLPPVYKNVLSCDKYGLVKENYMISDKSWSFGYHITHWMPLPEPPKGVE